MPFKCLLNKIAFLSALLIGLNLHPSVVAQTQQKTGHVNSELVSSVSEIIPGQAFYLALKQKIKKGWHIYWRNPGSSGEPVSFEWTLPSGLKAEDIIWPVPEVVATGPIINYAFEGMIFLPVRVQTSPALQQDQIPVTLQASWLVCKNICIPEEARFTLDLKVNSTAQISDTASKTSHTKAINKAVKAAPQQRENVTSYLNLEKDQLVLTVKADFLNGKRIKDLYFFPYDSGLIDHDITQKAKTGRTGIQISLAKGPYTGSKLNLPILGLLSYKKNGKADYFELEISDIKTGKAPDIGQITSHKAASVKGFNTTDISENGFLPFGEAPATFGILMAIIFAFLGGLILNLMPCVFPVLSIKAIKLSKTAHDSPSETRRQGLFFLIGILFSFLILSGLLILLKALGSEIGWGFQLQSPLMVASLALLMFLVGLNFLGYFDLQLSLGGQALNLTDRSDIWGAFFTGVLTVLVATPCTAPFMATALGFALTQPWYLALIVFLSLGFGLAFPFFILSLFPQTLKFLPKPGPWMIRFKEFLAFPMLAAGVWLVWVLARQTGADGVLYILSAGLALVLTIWTLKFISKRWAKLLLTVSLISLGLSFYALSGQSSDTAPLLSDRSDITEETGSFEIIKQPWSRQAVQTQTAQGKAIFVDFTADWCVTCKFNEKLVLDRRPIKKFMKQNDIVFLVADWTKYDPEITQELKKHNRAGVPLYLVYPAGNNTTPYILPQLLTFGNVKKALNRALNQKSDF